MRQFEFLPHTADALFRARGSTLEETFEAAAIAMFNVMLDTEHVKQATTSSIRVEADSIENLLVDFLSELLFMFEVDRLIFSDFKVTIQQNDQNILDGVAMGEEVDPERHKFSTDVKAITYHQLYVNKTQEGYEAQVLVDI